MWKRRASRILSKATEVRLVASRAMDVQRSNGSRDSTTTDRTCRSVEMATPGR